MPVKVNRFNNFKLICEPPLQPTIVKLKSNSINNIFSKKINKEIVKESYLQDRKPIINKYIKSNVNKSITANYIKIYGPFGYFGSISRYSSEKRKILEDKIYSELNLNKRKNMNKELMQKIKNLGGPNFAAEKSELSLSLTKSSRNFSKLVKKIYKNLQNTEKEYNIEFSNKSTISVIPYYYSNNFNAKNKVIIKEVGNSGAASSIYFKYYNKNNTTKTIKMDIIFKLTNYFNLDSKKSTIIKKNELTGLYFNLLLCEYYKANNPENLRYFCKLKEFGEVKDKKEFYAFMDNCGMPLNMLSNRNIESSSYTNLIKTLLLQTVSAIKLIHNVGYLHLDIKDINFLFTMNENNINTLKIKIIDFGMVAKNNTETNTIFGSPNYISNDWLINYQNGRKTLLKPYHDFFSLGCTILSVLLDIFESNIILLCPIKTNNDYFKSEDIMKFRRDYNERTHNDNMGQIKKKLKKNNITDANNIIIIDNIISKMVHPNIKSRFTSADEIIAEINKIRV